MLRRLEEPPSSRSPRGPGPGPGPGPGSYRGWWWCEPDAERGGSGALVVQLGAAPLGSVAQSINQEAASAPCVRADALRNSVHYYEYAPPLPLPYDLSFLHLRRPPSLLMDVSSLSILLDIRFASSLRANLSPLVLAAASPRSLP